MHGVIDYLQYTKARDVFQIRLQSARAALCCGVLGPEISEALMAECDELCMMLADIDRELEADRQATAIQFRARWRRLYGGR